MIAGEAAPSSQRLQDAWSGTARPRACDHFPRSVVEFHSRWVARASCAAAARRLCDQPACEASHL